MLSSASAFSNCNGSWRLTPRMRPVLPPKRREPRVWPESTPFAAVKLPEPRGSHPNSDRAPRHADLSIPLSLGARFFDNLNIVASFVRCNFQTTLCLCITCQSSDYIWPSIHCQISLFSRKDRSLSQIPARPDAFRRSRGLPRSRPRLATRLACIQKPNWSEQAARPGQRVRPEQRVQPARRRYSWPVRECR